jgi:hypothetical protein
MMVVMMMMTSTVTRVTTDVTHHTTRDASDAQARSSLSFFARLGS